MSIIELGSWVVVCLVIFLIIFPLICIYENAKYTKRLIQHMSYSLGRELTQREKDQITFRNNPMYHSYWIKDLEESLKNGTVFKMPPSPANKFNGKIKENILNGDYNKYSLETLEEIPKEENNYQKIIDEEIEKKAEENDNIRRYMNHSKMAGEKRKCLVNPKDLF